MTTLTTRADAVLRAVEELATAAGAAAVGITTWRSTHDLQAAIGAAAGTQGAKQLLGLLLSSNATSGVIKAAKMLWQKDGPTVTKVAAEIAPALPDADAALLEQAITDLNAAEATWSTIAP